MKPYLRRQNPNNIALTDKFVETLLSEYGLNIKVQNINTYQTAFVHRSYLNTGLPEPQENDCMALKTECNETYEFLGDTLLSGIVGTYLYDNYPKKDEGFLTKTKTKMVRGTTLGELSKRLGFGKWIIISKHVELEDGRNNIRILEDVFESFLAAIYLDTNTNGEGYLIVQKFVLGVFRKFINLKNLVLYDDNYKDQLQHYFQREHGVYPIWTAINKKDTPHNAHNTHTICVCNHYGFPIGIASAKKKTDAEQLASREALLLLGEIQSYNVDYFF